MIRNAEGAAVFGGVVLSELFESGAVHTPAYIYDLDAVADAARSLRRGFGEQPHLIAYAIKANSAGPLIRLLAAEGCGADVVSGAELQLALACGIPPKKIVYSGVAKTDAEIDAAIGHGILSIHVESVEELIRIEARAHAQAARVAVGLRFNPEIEADTHAYIATGHDEAKFGVCERDIPSCLEVLRRSAAVALEGLSVHIGSQLLDTGAYLASAQRLLKLASSVETTLLTKVGFLDFGGGFGVDYGQGSAVEPRVFATELGALLRSAGRSQQYAIVEPGRCLVAPHGVLCASVIQTKRARFANHERDYLIIDAGMNDLIRPALYQAQHRIEAMTLNASESDTKMRVVGPVCESSDDFGFHTMPRVAPSRVVIRDAGAYGFTMASEYNGRALPLEVFLRNRQIDTILRPRSVSEWVASRSVR